MLKQSLTWTALPNGYSADGKSLRLSVLLSPRLTCDPADGTVYLDKYLDFCDWPSVLVRSKLIVHCGAAAVTIGADELAAQNRVDNHLGNVEPAVWKALFPEPEKVLVASFAFKDLSNHSVFSYSTRQMDALVRDLYTKLARSAGARLPKVSTLLNDPDWKQVIDAVSFTDRFSMDEKTKLPNPGKLRKLVEQGSTSKNPNVERLARFQLFHTPPSSPEVQKYKVNPGGPVKPGDPRENAAWRTHKRAQLPDKNVIAETIDFHQVVAAMNQYPTLLRMLGLVTDLLIDPKEFAKAPDQRLWVEVVLPPGAAGVERMPDASPRTRIRLTDKQFQPLPRPNLNAGDYRVKDGLVDINQDRWDLLQNDVDGAGLKLINFARTLRNLTEPNQFISAASKQLDPATRFEKETGTPSLRNAGLMLVHLDRGRFLKNAFDRNKQFNTPVETIHSGGSATPPDLFAEDLVRGYRIDIWDRQTNQWQSLCRRKSNYVFDGMEVEVPDEEGMVRLAATKSADPASNPDVVYLHEALVSWTGWSLCAPPPGKAIDKDDKPADAQAEVPPGIHMQVKFKAVDKSLPRLRYGRQYWIRARAADLAGNSLPPRRDDFGSENPGNHAKPYLRYDPIAPPAIALNRPGGSPEPEVPEEGESMERAAIRTFNETYNDPAPSTQKTTRVAVPARTTVREAEQHGMLDAGGKLDAGAYSMLVNTDNALEEVTVKASGPGTAPDGAEATYAVFDENGILPYLPEPLCGTIAAKIFNLPGYSNAAIIKIPLYPGGTSWPKARPFRIQILEQAGAPWYSAADHTLYIPLPKAARATLRLSALPEDERVLDMMGVWNWLHAADKAAMKPLALGGQHWMLTPWREVHLVHAVQKPLLLPLFRALSISRTFGATCAQPRFEATTSLKSTDHIDLRAEWHEPKDDPEKNEGTDVVRADHAFSVKITTPESYGGKPEHGLVPGQEDVIDVGMKFRSNKRHEFHDTRYRRIEYWIEATTSFREYMPPELLQKPDENNNPVPDDTHIKVSGDRAVQWIPNSSPPPAPEVLYVVPTFGWTRGEQDGKKSSWRRGGGLRVYLDRPWFASGYGEMLGVVLPPAGFAGDPNKDPVSQPLKNFVTQWGNDPIWKSPYVGGAAPGQADFPLHRMQPDPSGKWVPKFAAGTKEHDQPNAAFKTTGLRPPALKDENISVTVAPHDVFYDEERRLWYADIEVEAGQAYYPFIRLALARYQPISVTNAHLSDVVLADFMQLVPDRWLNVTQTGDPRTRRVTVSGPRFTDSSSSLEARKAPSTTVKINNKTIVRTPADVAQTSVVEVWVEKLNSARGEDFGWERLTDAVVQRDEKVLRPVKISEAVLAQKKARIAELELKRDFASILREDLVRPDFIQPVLWKGTVTLPSAPAPGESYRLVIAEYEEYLVDDASPYDATPTQKGRRLVFLEHVAL
jgi:hypothetical protein